MKKGLTLFLYVFVIMSVVLFNKNKTADDMYAFRENQKNPYFDFEKNVFNDLNTKKKFLSLFFLNRANNRLEKHICLFKNEIIELNKKSSYFETKRFEKQFNHLCLVRDENKRFIKTPKWARMMYISDDKKKICLSENDCAFILEDTKKRFSIGWDRWGIDVFEPEPNYSYNYIYESYDLKKKNPEFLRSFDENVVNIEFTMGGLGNQLFGYWTGVVYALKNNKVPRFYTTSMIEDLFDLPFKTTLKSNFKIWKEPKFVARYINTLGYRQGGGNHFVNPNEKFIHIEGYLQDWKNFQGYEDYIREHTIFKNKISEKSKQAIEQMEQEDSVVIHIRRGDYIKNGYYILDDSYYSKAVAYMKRHLKNPHFYIFTNDMRWVKQNFKIDAPHTFVDWNKKDYEDLQLMTYCKHFIISNSTFSWWGSFLSKNKDKIVIAPDKLAPWAANWMRHLLSPEFIVIDIDK